MLEKNMGIFISKKKYRNLLAGRSYHSNIFYEEAASSNNLRLYHISLHHIVMEGNIMTKAVFWNSEKKGYDEEIIPLPRVIYNRVSLKRKGVRDKVKQLLDKGYEIFNSIPFKNGKSKMNQLLEQNAKIAQHLPKTLEANESNIKLMMNQFDKLFIKPHYASIGKGIMFMEKEEEKWVLHYRDNRQNWHKATFSSDLPSVLKKAISSRPFIVQERIPLATYNERTFDTRVIVQKNETGKWAITGMVGKLAQKGHMITNVGMGGDFDNIVTYLEKNPSFSPEVICQDIEELALNIAHDLEKYSYHIADLGMDIGVAENGKPYFIECNFRSQYSGMETNESLEDVCRNLYSNPIRYGSYLLNKLET